jgi:hypothetical protein
MQKQTSFFLSGLLFTFLGSIISGLGFAGVVILGKVTSFITNGNSSNLTVVLFILIYGSYVVSLAWELESSLFLGTQEIKINS